MKKFILLVLVLTLVCTSSLCAYAQNAFPEEFTLWGIPFGTSEEDFLKIATEKSGFVFTLDDGSNLDTITYASLFSCNKTIEHDTIYYVDTTKQTISFLGYPLKGAYAVFHASDADSSGFKMFRFQFAYIDPGSMEYEKMIETLFNSVSKSYGSMTNGWMYVVSDNSIAIYDPPVQNGTLDTATITEVVNDNTLTRIDLCWNNVRLINIESVTHLDFYGFPADYSEGESSIGKYPMKNINVGL